MSIERPRVDLLVVSTTLSAGGAQRFASTLLGHLDRSRIQPSLCLLRAEIEFPLPADVPVQAFNYQRRPWQLLPTVRRLRRLIDDSRPDVVLSNIAATNLVTGAALAGSEHRPSWIARVGNDPLYHDGAWRRMLASRHYGRADRVVVNSRGLAASVAECYPAIAGRVDVLPNPTDVVAIGARSGEPPEYQRSFEEPLLVAVGRLFRQKRYDLMIEAFARVRAQQPARLWICGEGPERGALEKQLRRLGMEGSVRLLGFCDNPFAIMRQADLFVMSSDHEGLPNALIEAQCLGLPAVSTACPHGPDEIVIDGETGLLVPVDDAVALGQAISRLLVDAEQRPRMGHAAEVVANERYAAPGITTRWEDLLLAVVDEASHESSTVNA